MSINKIDKETRVVLSYHQLNRFFKSLEEGKPVISFDLGLTEQPAVFEGRNLVLPNKNKLPLTTFEEMMVDKRTCYFVEGEEVKKLMFFSEDTKSVYKMIPTDDAPALEISGILMHRIKHTTPWKDAETKIRILQPRGSMLDTNCGFGYTAINASRAGCDVITVEIDPNVLELAGYNPWSRALFDGSAGIELIHADIFHHIETFQNEQFDCILHDPPTLGRTEYLYSSEFYSKLKRVMKKGAKLFHYVGSPGSRARGIYLIGNVKSKLNQAGFSRITKSAELESLVAVK